MSSDITAMAGQRPRIEAVAWHASVALVTALFASIAALRTRIAERLLLAALLFDIPFAIDVSLSHRDEFSDLGSLGGYSVSVTTFALCGLYLRWAVQLVLVEHAIDRTRLSLSLPALAFVVFSGLSIIVAPDQTLALAELWLLVQMFLVHLYLLHRVRTRRDVVFVVTTLIAGLALEGIVMMALKYTGQAFSIAGIHGRVMADPESALGDRIGGTSLSPNMAAAYLTLLLPPTAMVYFTPLGVAYKLLSGLAVVVGLLGLIFTQSRGGWLGFSIAVASATALMWRQSPRRVVLALLLAGALLIALLPFEQALLYRFTHDDDGAAASRVPLMEIALEMIRDNPLLGVGLNNFAVATLDRYDLPEWINTVHNKYLLVWAEAGPAALAAFVWFLAGAIRRGWKVVIEEDPLLAPLAIGLTAALIGHAAHLHVDRFNGRPIVQTLWVACTLIHAVGCISATGVPNASARWSPISARAPHHRRGRSARAAQC